MAKWMTRNLEDLLASGAYVKEDRRIAGGAIAGVAVDASDRSAFLYQNAQIKDHYMCPGCRHWRVAFALVDCRHIDPLAGTEGQAFMCDGCWTYMVHMAGKRASLYDKLAADTREIGAASTFRQRQSFLRGRLNRAARREKPIDDMIDPLADVMQAAARLDEVDAAAIAKPGGGMVTAQEAGDFMVQCKMRDGVLITKRTTRNMPISLWLELHNAPAPFIARFRGKPRDFLP